LNNCKTTLCIELGPAQCYSTERSNRPRPARVRTAPRSRPPPPSCRPHRPLPAAFRLHAPHMQLPPVSNASSGRPDYDLARATAARPPATSRRRCRPTLPTSCHLRSTRCTCSHRLCTLPPHHRSGGEAVHSSSHSYRRASTTPLELAIVTVPRPPSIAASSAPPAPSTLPVASPELGGALHPHQPSQRQPADPLTGASLWPTAIISASPLR
jgi:hypothetical protein